MTAKLAIVDTHCHLWTRELAERGWLTPEFGPLFRSFSPADFVEASAPHGVEACVLIDSGVNPEDNQLLEQAAESNAVVAGFAPFVDLESPELPRQLDSWQQRSTVSGLRARFEGHPDPNVLTRPSIIEGLSQVSQRGLRFEFLVVSEQLKHVLALYARVPDLKAAIDHMGKPDVPGGTGREQWIESMKLLSRNTPLVCKLSFGPRGEQIPGLLKDTGRGWNVEALKPYVQTVLEHFGADRLMWGSDWPVSLLTASYGDTLSAMRKAIGTLTTREESQIFRTTAITFYRLALHEQRRQTSDRPLTGKTNARNGQ